MREAGEGPGISGAPRIVESRICGGCGEPSGKQNHCHRCAEEIAALEQMAAQEDMREMGIFFAEEQDERESLSGWRLRAVLLSLKTMTWLAVWILVARLAWQMGRWLAGFMQWWNSAR